MAATVPKVLPEVVEELESCLKADLLRKKASEPRWRKQEADVWEKALDVRSCQLNVRAADWRPRGN